MAKTLQRVSGLMLLTGSIASCDASVDPEREVTNAMDSSQVQPESADLDAGRTTGVRDAALDARPALQQLDAASDARVPEPGSQAPDAGPHTFKVNSKDVWTASGYRVEAGRCYELAAKIDDRWLDLDVPADLSGWLDKQDPRLVLFTPFRRVVQEDIGFYEFAACVDKALDLCFAVGMLTTACPKASGELFFFVNDASGFEANNVGTATVSIRAN